MPTHGKSRRQTARGWLGRDNRHALAVCLLFGAIVAVGLGTVIRHAPMTMLGVAAADGHGDGGLTTGSIIFVPILGNICRKRLIENTSWQIRDNGLVDCRAALAQGAHGNQLGWSVARVDVIRHGFYNR
jgi:hypothetical protein